MVMWTFAWLFILEGVFITVANAITIVIFTRTRRLHSKQYILIISQAVADLLVGLVSVPVYTVWRVMWQGDRNSGFYDVFIKIESFLATASLFGLAAMAIERAHATYFPFRHYTLGKCPYIMGIVFTWSVPIFVALLSIFTSPEDGLRFYIGVLGFILVIITAAYSLIVLKVRCVTTIQSHDVTIQENKKLTVTLAVVTALSLVTWLPFQCLAVAGLQNASLFIYYPAKFLQYGNSLVNSVVYAFRMREIKREILRVFQCCRTNQISINNESELGNM